MTHAADYDFVILGGWRHLCGSEGTNAPLYVRNNIDCYDPRLPAGGTTTLPSRRGQHTYLYVFGGTVETGNEPGRFIESALVAGEDVAVRATEDATIVAFSINPDAPITHQATIGR